MFFAYVFAALLVANVFVLPTESRGVQDSDCKDLGEYCKDLKHECQSHEKANVEAMHEHCPVTCNVCHLRRTQS